MHYMLFQIQKVVIFQKDEHFMPKTAFASKYRYFTSKQVFISISCLKQHFMLNTPFTCNFMSKARKYWSYIAFHAISQEKHPFMPISLNPYK